MSIVVESQEGASDNGLLAGPPQELMEELDMQGTQGTVVKINRFGTAFAVGTSCGSILIYDYTTKLLVTELRDHHTYPVCFIDWSHNGRFVASTSESGTLIVTEILTKAKLLSISLHMMGTTVLFHPRNANLITYLRRDGTAFSITVKGNQQAQYDYKSVSQIADDNVTAICYSKRGKYLIAGTNKVKQICISTKGDFLATNTNDRCIRVYIFDLLLDAKSGDYIHHYCKFMDAVSKRVYLYIAFSPDARYICSTEQNNHEITIWDIKNGSVAPSLRGKTLGDAPTDLAWHPKRMEILTVARGKVHVFGRRCYTTMSAFAPDFIEIHENIVYDETEGEFDLYDEDASLPDKPIEPEVEVEIETLVSAEMTWNSSDEEDIDWKDALKTGKGPLVFIPVGLQSLPLDEQQDDEIDPYYEAMVCDNPQYSQIPTSTPTKKKSDDEIFLKPKLPKEEPNSRSSSRTSGIGGNSSDNSVIDTKPTRTKKPRLQFDP
ncbi:hypothetical protein FO519_008966 [Halicephalobus sp. NKZ332]|nr:hypothetical protein FO519_008966 [Halicephalobus sp. NKZ332]